MLVGGVVAVMRGSFLRLQTRVAEQKQARQHHRTIDGDIVMLSLIDQTLDKRRKEAGRLIATLPLDAVLTILGDSEAGALRDPARTVVRLVDHFCKWSASTIVSGMNIWKRLTKFLSDRNLAYDGDFVKGCDISDFIRNIDTLARAKAAARVLKRKAAPSGARASTATRVTKRVNSGSSAAISAQAALRWMCDRAGFTKIILYAPVVDSATPKRHRKTDDSSPALTPGIMVRIELASVDEELSLPVRASCSFICRMAYSALREQQAQTSKIIDHDFGKNIPGKDDEDTGCSLGVTERDKHPDPSLAKPAGWFCVNEGLVTGTRWQEAEALALAEVIAANGYFLGRDTDSPDGDPNHPATTMFVDEPITGQRFLNMLRGVLRTQVGLTAREAEAFTASSLRSFLPACAALVSTMTPEESTEIGRWTDCALKADGVLSPPERRDADYKARISALPAAYAQNVAILYAARLARDTLKFVRSKVSALADPSTLVRLGHWHQYDRDLSVGSVQGVASPPPSTLAPCASLAELLEFTRSECVRLGIPLGDFATHLGSLATAQA